MEMWIKLSILSILQGVAEFLPISSSGHLVLFQNLLGIDSPGEDLEILLHAGTMLSIIIFYWKTLLELAMGLLKREKESLNTLLCIVLSAIPAAVFYILMKSRIDNAYGSTAFVGAMLLITGIVLLTLKFVPHGNKTVRPLNAIIVGIAQAVAILPGISRSGSTIACARMLGITPEKAASFSFIMSLPLIAGATVLMLLGHTGGVAEPAHVVAFPITMQLYAFALSSVVGYFSLKILVKMIRTGSFWLFGVYCIIAGIAALFIS